MEPKVSNQAFTGRQQQIHRQSVSHATIHLAKAIPPYRMENGGHRRAGAHGLADGAVGAPFHMGKRPRVPASVLV